jgi:hypothetical protein
VLEGWWNPDIGGYFIRVVIPVLGVVLLAAWAYDRRGERSAVEGVKGGVSDGDHSNASS